MGLIEEVITIELPVGESFRIQRCRYAPKKEDD